jgi:hypothetical protein
VTASRQGNQSVQRVPTASSRLPCATAGLAFGPRFGRISAARSCLRQPDIIEEYTRSLRSSAPRSPEFLHRSYACKIRHFSYGEMVRLRFVAKTSELETSRPDLPNASATPGDKSEIPAKDV